MNNREGNSSHIYFSNSFGKLMGSNFYLMPHKAKSCDLMIQPKEARNIITFQS